MLIVETKRESEKTDVGYQGNRRSVYHCLRLKSFDIQGQWTYNSILYIDLQDVLLYMLTFIAKMTYLVHKRIEKSSL